MFTKPNWGYKEPIDMNEFKPRNGLIIQTETASTDPYLDANKKLVSSDVTPTELDYLDGVSSNIQTQLDSKASSSSVTDHLNDTADAHDASAISSVAAGNLAATTVQAALDELQTDIDTRAPSNSPTLTTPTTDIITLDGQASTPANPSAGNYKVYVKDATQKLTVLDSTGAETTVGTGSGGGATTNYIASPDGTAIGDWATYDDGASSSPVDGTGGSPGATFAVSTSSTMRSTSNFLFTHDAANRQGEGFSYLMAIDPSDRGKVLRLSFDYLVASGTYADDGMSVWSYDATNATLIQPAPYLIKNSSLIERFNCEVQVPSSCASLRVIFHVTTTTATAYTIRFDDFNFGPQAKLYGSPITDWNTSWTPTGTLSTNVTYYGKWRKVGDSMQIEGMISFSGANTQGVANITLPNSANLDTTKFSPVATGRAVFGSARIYDSSTDQSYDAVVTYDTATSIRFSRGDTTAGSATDTSSNRPITFASGDIIAFNAIVPILGWSSSLVMSSDASTRVIGARFNNSATSISGTPAKVVWTNTDKDDVAGYSSGTYTIKVPGWYDIYASLYIAATPSVDQAAVIYIYRSGAAIKDYVHRYKVASATTLSISVNDCAYFTAGQTIDIYAESNATSPSISSSTTKNVFSISRRAGPAQIAASESVSALYTGAPPTGTLTSAYNTTTFGTKRKDSHNAYSSGTYTVPVSGTYSIAAQTRHDATYAAGNTAGIALFIDGVQYETGLNNAGGVEVTLWPQLSVHSVPLLAGQLVTIRSYNNGTTPVFVSNANQNYFSIVRTGNY